MKHLLPLCLLFLFVQCSSDDNLNSGLAGHTSIEENETPDFPNIDFGNDDDSDNESEEENDDSPQTGTSVNILFVGNSLTYFNNLPELVEIEARSKNITVRSEMLAYPNYAILDHWADGAVQNLIKSQTYDFVVIQQGPSSQAFGRQVLFEYGKKFSDLCNANNAKLAFFMVWPSRTYYYTFEGVIQNHRDAAIATGSILCPVGEIWKFHFDNTGDFSYYGADGFHPSLKGSQVAAEVIVATLL